MRILFSWRNPKTKSIIHQSIQPNRGEEEKKRKNSVRENQHKVDGHNTHNKWLCWLRSTSRIYNCNAINWPKKCASIFPAFVSLRLLLLLLFSFHSIFPWFRCLYLFYCLSSRKFVKHELQVHNIRTHQHQTSHRHKATRANWIEKSTVVFLFLRWKATHEKKKKDSLIHSCGIGWLVIMNSLWNKNSFFQNKNSTFALTP